MNDVNHQKSRMLARVVRLNISDVSYLCEKTAPACSHKSPTLKSTKSLQAFEEQFSGFFKFFNVLIITL